MRYLYTINGQQFDVQIQSTGGAPAAAGAGSAVNAAALASMPAAGVGEELTAGNSGRVGSILVGVGQMVGAGQSLVTLEAGGGVCAPRPGLVKQILVKKGTAVETGDVLVVLN